MLDSGDCYRAGISTRVIKLRPCLLPSAMLRFALVLSTLALGFQSPREFFLPLPLPKLDDVEGDANDQSETGNDPIQ